LQGLYIVVTKALDCLSVDSLCGADVDISLLHRCC